MNQRWTKDKANEWYKKQGWLRGCNFIGSDCTLIDLICGNHIKVKKSY